MNEITYFWYGANGYIVLSKFYSMHLNDCHREDVRAI
ncbi:hypothetical protein SRABI118_01820 [Massilia sp. Bi118]|nr:hypothetical protein SRABI118_01820 [Massilia sp. Bi118]